MDVLEWYFTFHPPHRETIWGIFGHVEAFGYTRDDTWLFIDSERTGMTIRVTHHHDEVEALMARQFRPNATVLRLRKKSALVLPPVTLLSCVSVCAHIAGVRASTPWGLKRRLLRNGAEVIHGRAKGRSEGQAGPRAPEADGATGTQGRSPA